MDNEVIQVDSSELIELVWRNRIVGHQMIDPRTLTGNPKNFRIHIVEQQEVVGDSLEELGWIDEVTVNINTDYVLDGHLRVGLSLRRMAQEGFNMDDPSEDSDELKARLYAFMIPVKFVDLTEEEEALAIVLFDQTTNMAGIDRKKLTDVTKDIETHRENLRKFMDSLTGKVATLEEEISQQQQKINEDAGEGMVADIEAECHIEIICTAGDLEEFQSTLRKWGRRPNVTVNFEVP